MFVQAYGNAVAVRESFCKDEKQHLYNTPQTFLDFVKTFIDVVGRNREALHKQRSVCNTSENYHV